MTFRSSGTSAAAHLSPIHFSYSVSTLVAHTSLATTACSRFHGRIQVIGTPRALGASAIILAATFGMAASSASAATTPTIVVGKVTKVTSTDLQVKTSTRVVTGKISTIAIITKSVRSTLSAVTKGTFVTLVLTANGKTVNGITVGSHGPGGFRGAGFPRTGQPPRTGRPGTRPPGTRPPGSFGAGRFHGGQVVSVSHSRISLKSFQGKTTAYSLAKSVTVTKTVRGTRADLHVGETVRIIPIGASNSSFSLTIVSG